MGDGSWQLRSIEFRDTPYPRSCTLSRFPRLATRRRCRAVAVLFCGVCVCVCVCVWGAWVVRDLREDVWWVSVSACACSASECTNTDLPGRGDYSFRREKFPAHGSGADAVVDARAETDLGEVGLRKGCECACAVCACVRARARVCVCVCGGGYRGYACRSGENACAPRR